MRTLCIKRLEEHSFKMSATGYVRDLFLALTCISRVVVSVDNEIGYILTEEYRHGHPFGKATSDLK